MESNVQLVRRKNAEMAKATAKRREFLMELLAVGGDLPADAERWVADCLVRGGYLMGKMVAESNRHELALELLGLSAHPGRDGSPALAAGVAEEVCGFRYVLAIVLAAHEEFVARDAWREPSTGIADYLLKVQSWGRPLSDREQEAVSRRYGSAEA